MAKTTSGERIVVQGFRQGVGAGPPYVFIGVLDNNDHWATQFSVSTVGANELGEFLRQEAEFAASEREEQVAE